MGSEGANIGDVDWIEGATLKYKLIQYCRKRRLTAKSKKKPTNLKEKHSVSDSVTRLEFGDRD